MLTRTFLSALALLGLLGTTPLARADAAASGKSAEEASFSLYFTAGVMGAIEPGG